jgi:soluble cytochrome b562
MPINPKQLKALVDQEEGNPTDEFEEDGSDSEEEEGDDASPDPLADMGDFAEMLRENASEIEGLSDEIEEQLAENPEPSEETKAKISEDLGKMPGALQEGFKQFIANLDFSGCVAVAKKLADEGIIEDAERFAGWLYWAGKAQ